MFVSKTICQDIFELPLNKSVIIYF